MTLKIEIGQLSSFSIHVCPPQLFCRSKAYLADAIAALIGSMLGVSTVATFAESTAGVADGAKTGTRDPRGSPSALGASLQGQRMTTVFS